MEEAVKTEVTLTERQRYWLEHLQACGSLNISILEYCTTHGINSYAMYAGKKKLVEKGALPRTRSLRFQRAQIVDAGTGNEWRIQLPNGMVVSFAGTVDAQALTTVLTATARIA